MGELLSAHWKMKTSWGNFCFEELKSVYRALPTFQTCSFSRRKARIISEIIIRYLDLSWYLNRLIFNLKRFYVCILFVRRLMVVYATHLYLIVPYVYIMSCLTKEIARPWSVVLVEGYIEFFVVKGTHKITERLFGWTFANCKCLEFKESVYNGKKAYKCCILNWWTHSTNHYKI